jgi:UPF0271 protein
VAAIDLNADLGESFGVWRLDDPAAIADRVVSMVTSGRIIATDGTQIDVSVESVCVHGDSPAAVAAGADIRAFC